jgi:O-antigen ligase
VAEGGSYIEGGPGKVVSELGVPGALALLMLLLAYIRSAYQKVIKGRFKDTAEVTGVFLIALVLTHMIEIVLSHQIYGDPLIGVLTGFVFGFLMSYPRIKQENIALPVKQGPQGNV